MRQRILVFLTAAGVAAAIAGCGSSDAKSYDISSIFPLSSGKCARYNGDQQGSGITATCMVTKSDCERAAADWRNAMASGGVNDAMEFSCG